MSSIVQIKDSAYDGLQSLRVYGNTVQNLWVNPSGTSGGITTTSNTDGSVTIRGTATGQGVSGQKVIHSLKPSTQYTLSIDKTVPNSSASGFVVAEVWGGSWRVQHRVGMGSTNVVTFTTSEHLERVDIGFVVTDDTGEALSGTYRVMLNEGSAAKPWCPPGLNSVGDDGSVDIVTAGKNLVRVNSGTHVVNGITYTIYSNGSVHFSGTSTTRSNYPDAVFDLPAGDYVLSGAKNGKCNAFLSYTGDDGTTKYVDGYADAGGVVKFTLSSKKTVGISYDVRTPGTVDTTLYPQIELGSTATDYEPPNITTTPIDLQGHTLNALPDGTCDELTIDATGAVTLTKRVGVSTAPTAAGSWKWEMAGDGIASFTLPAKSTGMQTDMTEIMRCDKLPVRQASGLASYAIVGTTQGHAKNPAITSTATAVTVAGGAKYIYKLAEPKTIDLGTIDLPKLRKKPLVNTIWANGTADGTGFSLAPEIDCEYNRWSTYCDGFKTHGKHSYFDMGCCLAARDTGAPEKKSVTATVPYMSGFYDFSKLYGAIAFEARQLTYRFEFVEDSREELQQKKSQFLEWLSQVHDEEIADDDIPGRHFIGSLSEWEFEEGEEGQSGSLEVTFNCQPFLEADEDTTATLNAGARTVTVKGQAVNAYAKTNSGTSTIQIGGATQSVGTTEIRLSVQLQPGDNAVTITGSPVVLRWKELTA